MAKVLVVDDEHDIRTLLVDILLDAGYDVVDAQDGGEALEKAASEEPDIILLDVLMPVMDGLQVLKRLREDQNTNAIPVILLTAFSLEESQLSKMTTGVSHLSKPWRRGAVESAIKDALAAAGKSDSPP